MMHVADRTATRGNPKREWNYADESEIGEACNMARTANRAHLATTVLKRYRATFVLEPFAV